MLKAVLLPGDDLSSFLQAWGKQIPILLVADPAPSPPAPDLFSLGIFDLLNLPLDMAKLQQDLLELRHQIETDKDPSFFSGSSLPEQKLLVGKLLLNYARRLPADRQLNELEANDFYGTHFRTGAFRCLALCLDFLHSSAGFDPARLLAQAQTTLLAYTARLCFESFPEQDDFRCWILLNYSPACDNEILAQLQQSLTAVRRQLPDSVSITLCCSQMHTSLTEISSMLDEAGDAIWDRLNDHTGQFLISTPSAPCPKEWMQFFDIREQQLKSACAILDLELFQQELRALSQLPAPCKSRHEMRMVLRHTRQYMFQINRELIASFGDSANTYRELTLQLRQASCVEEYLQTYAQQMSALFQKIRGNSVSQHSQPLRQAKQLIRQNLSSPLNLDFVAQQVGLSPGYFSAIFKKETGIGFSNYVNQCRIEQAKKLLEETGLKVLAISDAVGFSNPRYFSRVFRDLVGVRPSEYRIAVQRRGQRSGDLGP